MSRWAVFNLKQGRCVAIMQHSGAEEAQASQRVELGGPVFQHFNL